MHPPGRPQDSRCRVQTWYRRAEQSATPRHARRGVSPGDHRTASTRPRSCLWHILHHHSPPPDHPRRYRTRNPFGKRSDDHRPLARRLRATLGTLGIVLNGFLLKSPERCEEGRGGSPWGPVRPYAHQEVPGNPSFHPPRKSQTR